MGASLRETGPFACSCLPFPGPQRPIKGTLMEDDKRQPTPLLSVCASYRHSVYPPKMAHFFLYSYFIKHSSSSVSRHLISRPREGDFKVKGCSRLRPLELANITPLMNLSTFVVIWLFQLPNAPNLYYLFVSSPGFLKASGWFQNHPSEPQCHFQFQGC